MARFSINDINAMMSSTFTPGTPAQPQQQPVQPVQPAQQQPVPPVRPQPAPAQPAQQPVQPQPAAPAQQPAQPQPAAPAQPGSARSYKSRCAKKAWLAVVMLALFIVANVLRGFISPLATSKNVSEATNKLMSGLTTVLTWAGVVMVLICIWATACAIVLAIASRWARKYERASTPAKRSEANVKLGTYAAIADGLSFRFGSNRGSKHLKRAIICLVIAIISAIIMTIFGTKTAMWCVIIATILKIVVIACVVLMLYSIVLLALSSALKNAEAKQANPPAGQTPEEAEDINEKVENLRDILSVLPLH